ncbi:iron uptake system protein EfeO [Aestuariivirga sp.]|uniref:iron uptake system protein EfeO n=1 Tax=Aestuariivirga sp. TaxID=2650926 RepID=UPI0039E3486C
MFRRILVTTILPTVLLSGTALAEDPKIDLVGPLADYKIFVSENTQKLVADVTSFTDAVKAGDLDKAKALFGPTRMSYERIEPIAELFSDLDASIDSRADDYEKRESDPQFPGFHRIEYGLWAQNSTEGLAGVADKLLTDVKELDKRISELTFPPDKVVGGAGALMEEVAATKVSGEEDRYSHTDLFDFDANVAGSRKIVDLVRPLITEKESDFLKKVDANFATVDATLSKYREGDGYASYEKLTEPDRKVVAAAVNALAEDLSQLRGKLGLSASN